MIPEQHTTCGSATAVGSKCPRKLKGLEIMLPLTGYDDKPGGRASVGDVVVAIVVIFYRSIF